MVRTMTALFLVVLSCSSSSPTRTASIYVGQLQPLLQENSLLAERVLLQAADLYNNAARSEDVVQKWETDITPVAEHLHFQAKHAEVPEEWSERHDQLVRIWGDRGGAYRDITEGLRLVNRERWDRGTKSADEVKLAEEDWFVAINEELGAINVSLDPYP